MSLPSGKKRAPLNRTINITSKEIKYYSPRLQKIDTYVTYSDIENRIINNNIFDILDFLPSSFVDLMFIDPPYNLPKKFNTETFKEMKPGDYEIWIDSWLSKLIRLLKANASVYICCDWKSSPAVFNVARKYLKIRNRITWEREKGRGAKSNWKNCSEDIWFCTMSDNFTFNIEGVKIKRKVLAPYKNDKGEPKDWKNDGKENFRITYPSNIWTDITVPFWSMPENTDHPTQKPEKLLAKIILASSNPGDFVFDPFLGSGTTLVTAKKLGRKFSGIEMDKLYSCIAAKRLHLAEKDKSIQGYEDGVFWERNTFESQKSKVKSRMEEVGESKPEVRSQRSEVRD
jgi:site-specific DNA-methyltransferase (adenine-specific)